MKKTLFSTALLTLSFLSYSQSADFELPLSGADTSWHGQDSWLSDTNHFVSGDFIFESKYSITQYGSWANGWIYSNITDTITSGATNAMSAFAKGGANGSDNFAICNTSGNHRIFKVDGNTFEPQSVQITNATYTAISMRDGDAFAHQFGDMSNSAGGQDSLVLSIYALGSDSTRNGDSINVYLADFTDGNTMILGAWLNVDLTSLGTVKGLDFGLTSSDVGTWGMNTPAFFALDSLVAVGTLTANLDDNPLAPESAWYGQYKTYSTVNYFEDHIFSFQNTFTVSQYGPYSSAWSYSNITDNNTSGPGNQYSAITGEGVNSSNYAVCNGPVQRVFEKDGNAFTSVGGYFTNTTYAYHSMLNGDAFATQFGDVTNTAGGEDWFLLTIYGLDVDSNRTADSVNFYLADYRFADDNEDYLIEEWTYVDLSSLGNIYGYEFALSSSDEGMWGMNTPAYFAMDKLGAEDTTISINEIKTIEVSIYPNPTNDIINYVIDQNEVNDIRIITAEGKTISQFQPNKSLGQISLHQFGSGIYFIEFAGTNSSVMRKVLVH